MRISVELILSLLAQGESESSMACLAYAHAVIARDSLDAVNVGGE
jgi:hypothetical protein